MKDYISIISITMQDGKNFIIPPIIGKYDCDEILHSVGKDGLVCFSYKLRRGEPRTYAVINTKNIAYIEQTYEKQSEGDLELYNELETKVEIVNSTKIRIVTSQQNQYIEVPLIDMDCSDFIVCVITNTEIREAIVCLKTKKVEGVIKENKKILGNNISNIYINGTPISNMDLQKEIYDYRVSYLPFPDEKLQKVFIHSMYVED